jgi:uncharacterized protein (DUF302 family)
VSEIVARGREFVSERAKRLMFFEYASGLGFEETVAAVTEAAEGQGWHVLGVNDLQTTYQEAGHPDMTKVQTVELCNPDGAVRILSEDGNKRLAAMLPVQLAVYETHSGDVRVSGMNLGLMSRMFGGVIEQVMHQGAQDLDRTLAGVVKS